MSCHPVPKVQELFANANLLFIQNMRRAYAISPYNIWDFPAPYCQDDLGLSSYPRWLSGVEAHPHSTHLNPSSSTLYPKPYKKKKVFKRGE